MKRARMRIVSYLTATIMVAGCGEDGKKSAQPVDCESCGTGQVYWDLSVQRCRDDNTGLFVTDCCCNTLQNVSLLADFEYEQRADTNGSIITTWNDLYITGTVTNYGPKTIHDVGLKVWRVGNYGENYYVVGGLADSILEGYSIQFRRLWIRDDREATIRVKYETR